MPQPSVMKHQFSRVPPPQIQRSLLDRSHGYKTTFNSGDLVPILLDEVLPGDTFKLKSTLLARLSTMIFPIMDNIFLDTFFFFVPTRLVWNNWERFNGAQDDPADSIDFTIPYISTESASLDFALHSLGDYFGIPTAVAFEKSGANQQYINALPFRCYATIWNNWFRDQNLQDSIAVPVDNGPDDEGLYSVLKRGKRHDYFTSCLTSPQKGNPVDLPLGTTAPIVGDGTALKLFDGTDVNWVNYNNDIGTGLMGVTLSTAAIGAAPAGSVPLGDKVIGLHTTAASGMIADLSNATSATINQLRQAFAFQQMLERDMRGGTRYTEILKSRFGVEAQDYRLQRPEYLGGYSQRIDVRSVSQTSETLVGTPQGNLSAYATGTNQSGFNKSFPEHGYVIGLVNVRSDITYQEGLHKMWSRRSLEDFYDPLLAHLGEQAVLNKEICCDTAAPEDFDDVFGYQERWAEYRYKPSTVTGKFRSNAVGTLDAWHLATEFGTIPPLNAAFIVDDPPIDRVVAVSEALEPQILLDVYHDYKCARPMPVYSVPGLMRM